MKKLLAVAAAGFITVSASLCVFAQGINVSVNGEYINFENQAPVIVEGRTLIPLRGVFEKLGYSVEWEANTKTAVLENGYKTIRVQANSDTLSVDNTSKPLDVPAQIINSSMMLPLRAISENMDLYVEWEANTKTASISDTAPIPQFKEFSPETAVKFKEIAEKYKKIKEKISTSEYQKANSDFVNALQTGIEPDSETVDKFIEMANEVKPIFEELTSILEKSDELPDSYKPLLDTYSKALKSILPFIDRAVQYKDGEITFEELCKYYTQIQDDMQGVGVG